MFAVLPSTTNGKWQHDDDDDVAIATVATDAALTTTTIKIVRHRKNALSELRQHGHGTQIKL